MHVPCLRQGGSSHKLFETSGLPCRACKWCPATSFPQPSLTPSVSELIVRRAVYIKAEWKILSAPEDCCCALHNPVNDDCVLS